MIIRLYGECSSGWLGLQAVYPLIGAKFAGGRKYHACPDSYYQGDEASPMANMVEGYVKERQSHI